MEVKLFYEKERDALRQELQNLKGCQITFLTNSMTATGVLLGAGAALGTTSYSPLPYLFPLIILLPTWWVFFDKATTITRVVGYYRILERLMLEQHTAAHFTGWENALKEFREKQLIGELEPPTEFTTSRRFAWLLDTISLKTGHRYWVISYWTYFTLSALCLSLSIAYTVKRALNGGGIYLSGYASIIAITVALAAFFYTTYANAKITQELIHGRHSYDCNEKFWKKILGIPEIESKDTTTNIQSRA